MRERAAGDEDALPWGDEEVKEDSGDLSLVRASVFFMDELDLGVEAARRLASSLSTSTAGYRVREVINSYPCS